MKNKIFEPVNFNSKDEAKSSLVRSGDDGGNGMESRVAKLESDVENIKTNIADIKIDIREIKSDINSQFRDVRNEFKDIKNEMKLDFRIIFGTIITVALSLSGLIANSNGWL